MPHQKSADGWLSVTEVLSLSIPKPFLFRWYAKNGWDKCEQIKRESQELGVEFHHEVERKFDEQYAGRTDNIGRMVGNFWNEFVLKYRIELISKEPEGGLKDPTLKLQGTYDAILKIDGEMVVADWKTSNIMDKVSLPLQLAAYAHLHGVGITKGFGVRVDKVKDKVDVVRYDNLDKYWPKFLAALEVARFVKYGIEE